MTRIRLAGLALAAALAAGAATAAPPSAEQKAEFHRTCVGISQNEPLCACKADAAMDLVDAEFMGVIIAAMRGTVAPPAYEAPYNDYIAASTRVCGMGGI